MQVFSKEWFERHQRKLLWFANTNIGRRLFCINGNRSSIGKNKITKILPNAIFWYDKKTTIGLGLGATVFGAKFRQPTIGEFRTHDKFAKRLYYGLKPLWYILHGWDFMFGNLAQQLDFGFSTLTQYPGSTGTDNPVDGWVARDSVDETFSTVRAGAGNDAAITDTANYFIQLTASATTSQYQNVRRSIWCFDTSSIGTSQTVTATQFSIWGASKQNTIGSPNLHVGSATPASTTTLANSDYGNVGSTSFGNVTYANFDSTDSVYTNISLDSNGNANISLTGISKFVGRTQWDMNNDLTGVTWSSGGNARLYAYYANQTGTANDPKIVVTYVPPPLPPPPFIPRQAVNRASTY